MLLPPSYKQEPSKFMSHKQYLRQNEGVKKTGLP